MKMKSAKSRPRGFAVELAKIMPLILREFSKKQQKLLAKAELCLSQIVVLELLLEHGPCKMNQLAKRLNFTMSAVTAIVDKMIRLKLVKRTRSRQDRRVVNVSILSKGKSLIRQVNQARTNFAAELFSVLSKAERNEYLSLLIKVYNNIREGNETI